MTVSWLRASVTALLASMTLGGTALASPVAYTLSPVMSGSELSAVAVEMKLTGNAAGQTTIELPGDFGGVKDHWRYVRNFRVDGASFADDGTAKRVLRHAPGAALTLRYDVVSAYPADPTADDGNPYNGAVVRPGWFAAAGDFLFARPSGGDDAAATFAWAGWPAGWTHVSDADHGSMGRAMTVGDVVESTLLAGPDVVLRTRPLPGGMLRLATRGQWSWSMDGYADTMGRILSAERGFWGDVTGPFTVTLFQLIETKKHDSSGGTGRGDGFALYASPAVPENILDETIAHEHTHTWIARRVGKMPDDDVEAGLYWFSEGFTEFYTARTLLHAGLWTPRQFIDNLNGKLAVYASSPARAYPNAKITSDFWKDPAVEQLPYRRGELFAYFLDRKLRQSGRASGLDAVMFAMRDRWVAAPVGGKPPLLANLTAVLASFGLDIQIDLARYIDKGEPIALASNQFAGCATVATIAIPAFDPGFDRDASAKAGIFAGVDQHGAAYAAGLRDGMKRLARLGGQEGDSRVPLSYRVEAAEGVRVISWRPEGTARLTLQEVQLTPALPDARLAACTRTMSGA